MRKAVLEKLLEARKTRVPVALISNLKTGTQRIVTRKDAARDDLAEVLEQGFRFDLSQVVVREDEEFFVNIHNPPLKLVIIGAVHIAQALIPIARALGYDVLVIDPRGAFASPERFPDVRIEAQWPDEVLPAIDLDARTAMVLLTHDPKIDDPALDAALRSECFYIGALGSKRTHVKRLERFAVKGVTGESMRRVHAPVGLDIGARGAAEIAVAIAAQMTMVLRLGAKAP
jgi:xanthine dehydrogenase accessory factor